MKNYSVAFWVKSSGSGFSMCKWQQDDSVLGTRLQWLDTEGVGPCSRWVTGPVVLSIGIRCVPTADEWFYESEDAEDSRRFRIVGYESMSSLMGTCMRNCIYSMIASIQDTVQNDIEDDSFIQWAASEGKYDADDLMTWMMHMTCVKRHMTHDTVLVYLWSFVL